MKTMEYFEEYKQKLKRSIWKNEADYEDSHEIIFKDGSRKLNYRFLENETNLIVPHIVGFDECAVLFIKDTFMNREVIQFKLKKKHEEFAISANMDYVQEGEIWITAGPSYREKNVWNFSLDNAEKEHIFVLYSMLYDVVKNMSTYRMYFATMNITVTDDALHEWVDRRLTIGFKGDEGSENI